MRVLKKKVKKTKGQEKNEGLERVGDDLGVVGDIADWRVLSMKRDGEVVQRKEGVIDGLCGDEGEDVLKNKDESWKVSAGQRVRKE